MIPLHGFLASGLKPLLQDLTTVLACARSMRKLRDRPPQARDQRFL
jgi:hypothetical protein